MTTYLMRLIRRAQGNALALMPVRQPDAGGLAELFEQAEPTDTVTHRLATDSEQLSFSALPTENTQAAEGRKRDVPVIKVEKLFKEIRPSKDPVDLPESHKDQIEPKLNAQRFRDPDRTASSDLHAHGKPNKPRDLPTRDSNGFIESPPGLFEVNRPNHNHQTRAETNAMLVGVPNQVRRLPRDADAHATPSTPVLQIKNESEPSLESKGKLLSKRIDLPASSPLLPLRPSRQPGPRHERKPPQDDAVTVEIGSVVIESVKAPSASMQPAGLPHDQRRRRPKSMGSKIRDSRRLQRSVSRLTYGLGAL